MPNRPISTKISDFREVRLDEVARFLGVDPRTVRDRCKQGLIPRATGTKTGAVQTKGGHWRIRLRRSLDDSIPLWLLRMRNSGDPPHKLGFPIGDSEEEALEWGLLARVFCDDDSTFPCLIDWSDPLLNPQGLDVEKFLVVDEGDEVEVLVAKRLQREFLDLLRKPGPRSVATIRVLRLRVAIYQHWLDRETLPSVDAVRALLGISRDTFYRRYPKSAFRTLRAAVLGGFMREAPAMSPSATRDAEC